MPRSLYDITPLLPLIEEGFVLLTPNSRLARRIKKEWDQHQAAAANRVWAAVPVFPLQGWLSEQYEQALIGGRFEPLTPLRHDQALELWRQVIIAGQGDDKEFHLLRPAAAAELAAQARESLLLWRVEQGDPRWQGQFDLDPDCSAFLQWNKAFEQQLEANDQTTAAACIAQLAKLDTPLQALKIALVECSDIPPAQQAAIEALCTELHVVPPTARAPSEEVHPFVDKRAELHGIAQWARQVQREDSAANIGIVLTNMAEDRLPLEYLLRREFDCLGANYTSLPVNFSTGIPLAHAPVIRDALSLLELGLAHTTVPKVVNVLQSRFVDMPDADSALAQYLIERLYRDGREHIEVGELRFTASEIKLGEEQGLWLGKLLLQLSGMRELQRKTLPSQWSERFSDVLALWGWPGTAPLDSLEYQQVSLWYDALDEFKAYDSVCEPLGFASALNLLRDSCSRKMSQPQTPEATVQVLGPLEAVGLQFDHLWVSGMQAATWPAVARPNPFLPMAMQAQLDMPHATPEREWAIAEGRLRQYRNSVAALHASYCAQMDGVTELPSPLLATFECHEMPAVAPVWNSWLQQFEQRALETVLDDIAPAVDVSSGSQGSGGSGLLEDQSQCPFRAFAKRRLKVEPLGEFSLALSAGERGTIVHDALWVLWTDIKDHAALLALDDDAESAAINHAVEEGMARVKARRRRSLAEAYWRLEGQRLSSLLTQWLALERTRGAFVVLQAEQDVTLELAQLQLKMRIDRVDQLPDGSQIIIDYKSRANRVQDWLGERPAKPQLLLYGVASPVPAAGIAFAQVRPDDCKFVGLANVDVATGIRTDIDDVLDEPMDADHWASLNAQWRVNLERLAQAFVAGEAQVDPLKPDSCTWCGLQPLCRVAMSEVMENE